MSAEGQQTVRNAGLLIGQRGFHVAGALLVAILIPRLMGPEIFGKYTLITSLSMWFALFNSLSSAQIMGRFVPQLAREENPASLQKFLGNLFVVRLGNGVLAGAAYLLLTVLWFPELDRVALAFIALTVLFRTSGKLVFAFFLGLNQAAHWGAGEILRQWLSLAGLLPGFYFGGLRGACLGIALAEFCVLLVGILLARSYLVWSHLRLDRRYLAPFLQFSIAFFASNLLLTVAQRSGELLVRLASGDYVQVGYYGVAYKAYFLAAQTIWQLTMAFSPLVTSLRVQGNDEAIGRWIERLLKALAVSGVVASFGALLLGEALVVLVIGKNYQPVATNLLFLAPALLAYALASAARLLALTYDRPRFALEAAAIQVVGFAGFGFPLAARYGSAGACLAMLLSVAAYAAYFIWRMRGVRWLSLKGWAMPILLGLLFLPLAWLRSSWQINSALFLLFLVAYVSLLFLTKVIKPDEILSLKRALRSAPKSEPGAVATGY